MAEPGIAREDLFAGWRLFFERLADHMALTMVFEDLQWADAGLLDFIEHLLDWSTDKPIFILTLSRPELAERREGWPTGRPGAAQLYLEPLALEAMGELLDGLVAGLPADARERIAAQAGGVPLYAIETVRALADRGALVAGPDGRLTLEGDIGELDVPASLSSLLAARLDALEPDERELVKALAVFGGSFPRTAAASLTGIEERRLDDLLGSLVRKQVFVVRADPLSPERGQYAFAQTLLRTVAYDMLSRHERKVRHLAAAEHLRQAFPDDGEDVAEVIAHHYLDAYRAAQGDPDEEEHRARALEALRRAAQHAFTVGAPTPPSTPCAPRRSSPTTSASASSSPPRPPTRRRTRGSTRNPRSCSRSPRTRTGRRAVPTRPRASPPSTARRCAGSGASRTTSHSCERPSRCSARRRWTRPSRR